MKTSHRFAWLTAALALWTAIGNSQPLAKPLADFDKMVSELKTGSVVGEPIASGDTTVIPFAAVQFGLGSAGAMGGMAGGMGAKTVPLGVLIVEGDDVRVDLLPQQETKGSATMHQLIQAILDRKVSFMVNGVNLGNAPGTVADLAPSIAALTGQTTLMVNALNLGNLSTPRPTSPDAAKTISDLEAQAKKHPTADNYFKVGEALRKQGRKDKAAAAYQKAIKLRPDYPEATRALAELKK